MLELKSFFLAYIRSRSRFFAFILLLTGLIFLFDVLFASQGPYFNYFFFLSTFLTFLFLVYDFLIELQRYRKELLYGERKAKSPMEVLLTEKLEKSESELYQKKSDAENRYNDLVDYYTLWVHQIKTPIAASKLLVSEPRSPISTLRKLP